MRKLLHAIWGMLKYDQDFDGNNVFKIANENVWQKRKYLALSIERTAAGRSVSGAHGARQVRLQRLFLSSACGCFGSRSDL
jgi:hypothetical protein